MAENFVHESFIAPLYLETKHFHLSVLEDSLAKADYEAVMSSKKRLQGIFGLGSEWPKQDMTLEENIESLKVHKKEFDSREAFAYSVFNHNQTKCLGSVYIDPSQSQHYDCEVYLWIRDDSLWLDKELCNVILKWLSNDWPFSKIAFPGRCISWLEWNEQVNIVEKIV